jgi:hypothetical protein
MSRFKPLIYYPYIFIYAINIELLEEELEEQELEEELELLEELVNVIVVLA